MVSGYPSLKPALVMQVNVVGAGHQVGTINNGRTLAHYPTPTGYIKSEEGYPLDIDAEIVFGADWLEFDADGKFGRVNLKGVAKNKDGQFINFGYTGTYVLADELKAIFFGSPDAKSTGFGFGTVKYEFQVGDQKLKPLENGNFVGNGRFVLGEQGLSVLTKVSEVVASTDAE